MSGPGAEITQLRTDLAAANKRADTLAAASVIDGDELTRLREDYQELADDVMKPYLEPGEEWHGTSVVLDNLRNERKELTERREAARDDKPPLMCPRCIAAAKAVVENAAGGYITRVKQNAIAALDRLEVEDGK